jgi:hypothetical protein
MLLSLYQAGELKLDELVTRHYRLDQINDRGAPASVGGVDEQHVSLRPAQDVAGHRAKPLVGARV